jgi:hypothetical protein
VKLLIDACVPRSLAADLTAAGTMLSVSRTGRVAREMKKSLRRRGLQVEF